MATLADAQREDFELRVIAHLQRIYSADDPSEVSQDRLAPRVHSIIDRAMSWGIDEEDDLITFVEIAFEVGDDFDTDPENEWAVETLNSRDLNPHEKVGSLKAILDQAEMPDADAEAEAI